MSKRAATFATGLVLLLASAHFIHDVFTAGITMLSTAPVIMAVVLENAGDNLAAANGTYFMISFAARAMILLVVGALGDSIGLRAAFYWCAGFAMLGLPFVLLLPKSRSRL